MLQPVCCMYETNSWNTSRYLIQFVSLSVLQFELDCTGLGYFVFHDSTSIENKFYSFTWADHQVPAMRTDKLLLCPRIFNKHARRKKSLTKQNNSDVIKIIWNANFLQINCFPSIYKVLCTLNTIVNHIIGWELVELSRFCKLIVCKIYIAVSCKQLHTIAFEVCNWWDLMDDRKLLVSFV